MRAHQATPIARAAGLAAALTLLLAAAPVVAEAVVFEKEHDRVEEEREEGAGKERRRHVRGRADLLELLSPRAGDRFAAGETVTLAWRAGASFAEEEGRVEEWEAFLSLDGGRHYSFRLTPHLDIEIRSFTVRLPSLPSAEARLLIRAGDERRELEFELPWTFAIVAGGADEKVPPRALAAERGESARSGEQGVMSWIEGDRDGARSRAIEAPSRSASWHSTAAGGGLSLLPMAPTPSPSRLCLSELFSHPESRAQAMARATPQKSSQDRLAPRSQTCRINE